MELNIFLKKSPYLYHLTDRQNLDFIKQTNALFSTAELVKMSNVTVASSFLKSKRSAHAEVAINGHLVKIRDQKPLNKALGRALLDDWTPEQWIYHLNKRVFTWPNLKRLRAHFGTYESEKPIILRLITTEVLELNKNAELCRINSGDSRCIGHYNGNPVPRGNNTFKSIKDYEFSDLAEVTFPKILKLPLKWELGNSPEGPWKKQ